MRRNQKALPALALLPAGLAAGATLGVVTRRVNLPIAAADRDCLQIAREFTDYALVSPGASFQGLPLSGCQRVVTPVKYDLDGSVREPAMDYFVFTYGYCAPSGDEGHCPRPVQVIVDPPCGPAISGAAIKERVNVRGAEVAVKADGSLRIEVPSFKATIYALPGDYHERKQKALEVAEALHGANGLAAGLALGTNLRVDLGGSAVCG